jgi:PAS domain S-box-containing protein
MEDINSFSADSLKTSQQTSANYTEHDFLIALLGSSRDHIYFKDLNSRFIKVSDALAARHDSTPEQMLGKTDYDFFGPVHAQQAFDDEQEIMRTLEPIIDKEEREDNQDGTVSWVSTSKMPLFDLAGKLIGTFGISRDVTRRKKAENSREALFEISEAVFTSSDLFSLYKTIHEVVGKLMPAKNFYISLYDEKNQMLTFPYFVDEHDGPQPPKKIGRGLTEYVLRIGKPALIDAQTDLDLRFRGEVDLIGAPQALWLGVPLTVADRTIGVIVIQDYENVKAFGDEEVQILTFVAAQIAQVIERRINAEEIQKYTEKLKVINSAKDKFFSIISHDLRAPLNGLLSFSEILLEDFSSQPESEKKLFIENLQSSMKNLLTLTENLLTWAQLQSNGIKIEQQNVNLQKLIKSVLETQQLVAKNKMVSLEFDCSPEIEVFADPNMMETIIRNLVSNSLKFTKPNGSISVRAFLQDDIVLVHIKDNGIGMSKELTENLFKIDKKVTREGTLKEKGTGLGLVISKEFVEKNNGTFLLQSEIDEGTVITLSFKSAKQILSN